MTGLPIWTIYDSPKDHPGEFVARLFIGEKPTDSAIFAGNLDGLREEMTRRGYVCLTRHPDDDPVIVETWL